MKKLLLVLTILILISCASKKTLLKKTSENYNKEKIVAENENKENNVFINIAKPKVNKNKPKPLPSLKTYEVVKGDCLWSIAENETKDPFNWVYIYKDNYNVIGINPDLIYSGQKYELRNNYKYNGITLNWGYEMERKNGTWK